MRYWNRNVIPRWPVFHRGRRTTGRSKFSLRIKTRSQGGNIRKIPALPYALSCSCNELSLKDIARLCDVFYIGGTKCGALFGEAVVITQQNLIPHFFTVIKQNGALLAKGRMLGIQFDTLFEDDLYMKIGASAIAAADQIRDTLTKCGYRLFLDSPTNQVFIVMENEAAAQLARKAEITLWEKYDDSHTMVRFVTDWATQQRDVDMLVEILEQECNPTLACVS